MLFLKILFGFIILLLNLSTSRSIQWERVRCAGDPDPTSSDGTVADIGRFPWLGVVQHSFSVGGTMRFAITTGVLIHPAYAISPAEDIAKILRDQLKNSTKFIVWRSRSVKYALEVRDYLLHPEYTEGRTRATLALLELVTFGETGVGDNPNPVLPVCMPLKTAGSFTDIYAAKMTDENKELQKELYKMSFVDNRDCEEFYFTAKLTYKKMAPSLPTCAAVERPLPACIWDGGVALITRQAWGYWALLGFSVRGPGCGAPTRFLNMYDYMPWIDDVITPQPQDQEFIMNRIGVRQLSPIKIVLYDASKLMPAGIGQCERAERGHILYKESMEISSSKNMGQGFFFIAVSQIASFTCAAVNMEEVFAKSNTAIWIEHYCHKEIMGLAPSQEKSRDYRKLACFMYFKSAAFVEFRFKFSFKAVVHLSLYGVAEAARRIPSPFVITETTEPWWPTDLRIKWSHFGPHYLWWWDL